MHCLPPSLLHVSALIAPSSGNTFLYTPNQHVTTRIETHKQQHNEKRRPQEGFVPSGPYKIGTTLGTYIATTPAKKITAAASTNKNILKRNFKVFYTRTSTS
jgi:hypothetical protein